jgi:hypothetical protein
MAVLVLAIELAAGGLLLGCAPLGAWRRAAPELRRGGMWGIAAAAGAELLGRAWLGESPTLEILAAPAGPAGWLHLISGAAIAPGCWLLLLAGGREAAGALEESRRLARPGGLLMAAGAAGQVAAVLAALALRWGEPAGRALAVSLGAGAAAGFAGLLAGLAGKPRPTGQLAAALLAVATVAWLAAG